MQEKCLNFKIIFRIHLIFKSCYKNYGPFNLMQNECSLNISMMYCHREPLARPSTRCCTTETNCRWTTWRASLIICATATKSFKCPRRYRRPSTLRFDTRNAAVCCAAATCLSTAIFRNANRFYRTGSSSDTNPHTYSELTERLCYEYVDRFKHIRISA